MSTSLPGTVRWGRGSWDCTGQLPWASFCHVAPPFDMAFQGLRGGEGYPILSALSDVLPCARCLSSPPLFTPSSHLKSPLTLTSPMTNTRHLAHSALLTACLPLVSFVLRLEEAAVGSPIMLPQVIWGRLAGLEAPESNPASSSFHSRPARIPCPPAHRGGLWH